MNVARRGVVALAAALFLPVVAQAQGNAQAGYDKANTCAGCHSLPGYNNAYPTYRVPKLGGQQPSYIVAALKAYKSGDRPHATMHAQAASLSEQDIADIAAFISIAPAHK